MCELYKFFTITCKNYSLKGPHLYPLINNILFQKNVTNQPENQMTAKPFLKILSLAVFIAIASPDSSAMIIPDSVSSKPASPRAEELMLRLEVIKGMNKSDMSRLEKKSLRKEVRAIKKETKGLSGGVYLSVGAIIIVILLLILLL